MTGHLLMFTIYLKSSAKFICKVWDASNILTCLIDKELLSIHNIIRNFIKE